MLGAAPVSNNVMMETLGQPRHGPASDDIVHSTPGYSLFTGAQSPFNLNNCMLLLFLLFFLFFTALVKKR